VAAVRQPAAHPLDPLTAEEIREVATVLGRERDVKPPAWRFAAIELVEPSKAVARPPRPPGRVAAAVCWNRENGQACRAVVALPDAAVTAWEQLPGVQPNMTLDE
jgi:primary-amine oxidase